MQTGQPIRQQATRQIQQTETMPRTPRRPSAARRGMARLRALLGVALVFLGLFALAVGFVLNKASRISKGKGATSILDTIMNPRGKFPGLKRVNILLIGTDYDYVWNRGLVKSGLNGARTSRNTRSDTIAMLSLDMDHQKVSMLSVPRDTVVRAPETLDSDKIIVGKINGTYRRGGYPLLAQTVGQLLGVKPDYYIAVKPDALKNIVNALGGVEVETIDAFIYNDWAARLFVDMPQGKQTINGDQAIGFARFREADIYKRNPDHSPIPVPGSHDRFLLKSRHEIVHSKEEGEPRRMARQQQLIRAMARKAQMPQNLLKIDELVDLGLNQVDTNMSRDQLLALAALYRSIRPETIESGTLKGHGVIGSNGGYFFHPNDEKKEAMVDWLLRGDERAAHRLTVVEVQNGTDTTGAGNVIAEKLRAEEYDVRRVVNADRGSGGNEIEKSRVIYHTATTAHRAEVLAHLLGIEDLVKEPRPDQTGIEGYDDDPPEVTVLIGRDQASALKGR